MNGWKNVITGFLAVSLCVSGCSKTETGSTGTTQPASNKPIIGVSVLTLNNPFFKDMADAMIAEGEKKGFQVVALSGDLDPAKQKDQVKNFITQKMAAIVLTPCDSKSIGTSISDANAAGVPVFTADVACTADGVKVVNHCATDNLEGGRVAGRAMVELLKGRGKVAIIDHPTVESGQMREAGFLEVVSASPGIEVVAKLGAEGAREKAYAVAQDLVQSHPDLDAIFAINDPTALGALAALEKAGKADQIKIIGFDGQPEARLAIKAGKLYATVMQHPKEIGSKSIDNIAKYLSGEQVAAKELLTPVIYKQSDAAADADLK